MRSASRRGSGSGRRRAPPRASQVLAPGDEVVHLLEVDVPAVEGELGRELARAPPRPTASRSSWRRTPRPGGRRAPGRARAPRGRTSATSRRAACPPRRPPRRPRRPTCLLGVGEVERLPGAEADDRELDAGAPESAAAPYCLATHGAGEPTRRARARAAARSTRGPRGENFPVVSVLAPRCGAAAPARGLRLRAARRQPRRRGRRRPRRAPRRARAASCDGPRRRPRSCAGCTRRSRTRALPREPFRRLIEANRIDQARAPLRDLGRRARVLHVLGRPGRPARARHLRAGGRAGARRDERRRLHRPPARQLPPGPAARPRARPRLPAAGGSAPLRRRRRGARRARSRSRSRRCCASRPRGRAALLRGRACRSRRALGGRAGARRSRSSRAAGSPRSTLSSAPAGTSSRAGRLRPGRRSPGSPLRELVAADERRGRLRARSPASPAARRGTSRGGSRVLPRPKRLAVAALYAFARRVDDIADDADARAEERRAQARRLPGRRRGAPRRRPPTMPVLVALADAVGRYPVPQAALARPRAPAG